MKLGTLLGLAVLSWAMMLGLTLATVAEPIGIDERRRLVEERRTFNDCARHRASRRFVMVDPTKGYVRDNLIMLCGPVFPHTEQ